MSFPSEVSMANGQDTIRKVLKVLKVLSSFSPPSSARSPVFLLPRFNALLLPTMVTTEEV